MRVDEFDFDLPEHLIALRPAPRRDEARLLIIRADGRLEDRIVKELPELLSPGDRLVLNDTRVINAALKGVRPARDESGADVSVDVNLHTRDGDDLWRAFVRPAKRLRATDIIKFGHELSAEVEAMRDQGEAVLRFDKAGAALDAAIENVGAPPLPPYIARKRAPDARDAEDYQTVFAQEGGSVAAPTAGLHFTPEMFAALRARGVEQSRIRLDVGAGTFLPVKTERTEDHRMHAERYVVSQTEAAAINATRAEKGRIIAVGTTSLRSLESAADPEGRVRAEEADTDIFITPGYAFRCVDRLLTNFHLPRSTLFMLVCAFAGVETMKRAYAHAIAQNYRFYSYGDACFLERAR